MSQRVVITADPVGGGVPAYLVRVDGDQRDEVRAARRQRDEADAQRTVEVDAVRDASVRSVTTARPLDGATSIRPDRA